jgi:hypothetical protein
VVLDGKRGIDAEGVVSGEPGAVGTLRFDVVGTGGATIGRM